MSLYDFCWRWCSHGNITHLESAEPYRAGPILRGEREGREGGRELRRGEGEKRGEGGREREIIMKASIFLES